MRIDGPTGGRPGGSCRYSGKYVRSLLLGVFLLSAITATQNPAFGWGSMGHGHLTVGAVGHLSGPLGDFFQANVDDLRDRASMEPPGKHYIDIDYYPEFFAGTFPHDVNDLIDLYGYSIVESNGMGPWTYANYVDQLTGLMVSAQTHQDWLDLLDTAGDQAHYIEDMHNPLHLTQNYNGQLSGNTGIHSRYETQMVNRNLGSLTFSTSPAVHLPSVIDDVFDGIDDHYEYVDDIMAADDYADAQTSSYNTTYYNLLWQQTGAFTQQLFEEGAQAVANGWYTAWINAGSPIPNFGLAGDYNGNNAIDAGDYTVWRDAMATGATTLVNDASPGSVSDADFFYWRDHFGETMGAAAGALASAVPEPASGLLLLIGILGHCMCRRGSAARRCAVAE